MKRLNIKVIFAAFAVMLVMCVTVAVLSFTLADESSNNPSGAPAATAEASGTKTNIDYIILNSNSTEPDADTIYHMVEIGSSPEASALQNMVADGKFKDLVIDGNRTIADLMADGKIDYKYYAVGSINSNDAIHSEALVALKGADFVYVSNDPAHQYTGANDFPEDIKLELANAVSSRKIPFMIDSPSATQTISKQTIKTFTALADDVFYLYGVSRYTFSWKKEANGNYISAGDYFSRSSASSLFIPIHGNTTSANWETVGEEDSGITTIAKILTIKNGSGDTALTDLVMTGITTPYSPAQLATPQQPVDPAQYDNVYEISDDAPLRISGYISNEAVPDCIRTESIDISVDAEKSQLATIDFSQYDIIIIEEGCRSQVLSNDAYMNLSSAMYGMKHILYSADLLSASGGSSNPVVSDAANYAYVYDKAAYSTDVPRTTNVLVTDRERTEAYANANLPAAETDIVKIINNGSFRGIGGGDDSSNKYTVLEIQPCYPIDTVLAGKFTSIANNFASKSKRGDILSKTRFYDSGFYYLRTDGVLEGVTSDEISFDGNNSVTEMETTGDFSSISTSNEDKIQDYYAWEISKAKVAHATGLSMDEIVVVHMSTTEFNSSKATLLDNYDFIYVGGNNSSIKSIPFFTQTRQGSSTNVYNMYYHNGDAYQYPNDVYGAVNNSYGLLLGNDITYDKLEELQNYISKGMPVVFSSRVSKAFDEITAANKNTLHNIDPDSNMYKLLKYAKNTKENGAANVLWNFDESCTIQVLNDGEKYGKTYNGYATVFGGTGENDYMGNATTVDADRVDEVDLVTMLNSSNTRPKVALTLTPVKFVEGKADTAITNRNLKFNFDISGSSESYAINLYVDDDGNSRFTSDELISSVSSSATGSITAELADDFFGPVYWKIEVVDKVTGSSASSTGITKIKRSETDPKDQVNLLQIMPANGVTGQSGVGTLWFCTECQQYKKTMAGNRYTNTGKYDLGNYKNSSFGDNNSPWFDSNRYPLPNIADYDPNYKYQGNALGVHSHNFGIVKYDSNLTVGGTTGIDDWTTNWADSLTEDYEFNTTIMTTREYEALCDKIVNTYSGLDATEISSKSSDYLAQAADYQTCYLAMYNLINGDYSKVEDEDKVVFETKMAELGVSADTIASFGEAQGNLDAFLTGVRDGMIAQGSNWFDKGTYDLNVAEMDYEMKYHNYYDFYSLANALNNTLNRYGNYYHVNGNRDNLYNDLYVPWRNAKIYEKYFYDMYLENLQLGSVTEAGKPDFNDVFSIIVFGAAENFGNDDIKTDNALNALKDYMDNDGSVLLFHDTLNANGNSGVKMTEAFREYFGQDARHFNGSSTTPSSSIKTVSADKYFLSTLSTSGYASWKQLCTTAVTGRTGIGNSSQAADNGTGGFMNKYTLYFPSDCEGVPVQDSSFDYASFAASGSQIATDRAVQVNKGIVTMYPFAIDSQLMISATHTQAFALDVEDSEMTVWYSLSGGSNGTQSSVYVAEPRNGTENYFIYTYGNVTYCGAGHSLLTGIAKNNNDERRLLINIICNSVRKTAIGTNVKIFDHDAETNDIVQIDPDGNYFMKVDDMTIAPEFAYKATTDERKGVQVANVKIYYDLGYTLGASSAYDPDSDRFVLIFNADYPADGTIASGMFKQIDNTVALDKVTVNGVTTTKLNLKPEYFTPYNNEYTYIVVAVTDTDGKTTYKRIMIKMKPSLYDLT